MKIFIFIFFTFHHIKCQNSMQTWIWFQTSVLRFTVGWRGSTKQLSSYLSVQLLSPRAGPTSSPNALLDNKDLSVLESEGRGGGEDDCTQDHWLHKTGKNRRKMLCLSAEWGLDIQPLSHVTGGSGLSNNQEEYETKSRSAWIYCHGYTPLLTQLLHHIDLFQPGRMYTRGLNISPEWSDLKWLHRPRLP